MIEDRNEHKVNVVFLFVHTSQGIFIITSIYFRMREEYGKACAQPKLVAIHFRRTNTICKHIACVCGENTNEHEVGKLDGSIFKIHGKLISNGFQKMFSLYCSDVYLGSSQSNIFKRAVTDDRY